jgi:uncharacterized protein YjgD (DUF1641 family)
MAQPVPFRRYIPEDTKDELTRKVEAAPTEHADAVLSGYQLLQQLHDTGTLDLLRGMLGAGDAVVNHVVDIVSKPEMVNVLRSALALGTVLSNVDPDSLHTAIEGKPEDRNAKAPSLWAIGKQIRSEEARLGLAAAMNLLTVFGAAIKKQRKAAEE